ncbi:MAG: TRAFs-binding domain-containing protein [Vicinamibacterales bacterium]
MAKKTCFVVMGFGEKPDLATGRTLDLDKTYRIIIKKAVEDAGLECIRADDVIHSGVIDKPMYELLLGADVVVADLSTSNANAIYELGVRHALRPHTTIVLAESEFKFPFDLGHVTIRKYQHLGKGIDAEVAEDVRKELQQAIQKLADGPKVDSPVYTFLPALEDWKPTAAVPGPGARGAVAAPVAPIDARVSTLLELFREARVKEDWPLAADILQKLLARNPSDPYLNQQLALATYKSKKPDAESALNKAKDILQTLDPQNTTDAETLGLWGAVHKRLWEIKKEREALDEAIWALEKGFYVKNDHYNGINLAYLLNARATVSAPREGIADATIAERVRHRVIAICEKQIAAPIKDEHGDVDREQMYWVNASLVEALFGTGQLARATELKQQIAETAPEPWMPKTMEEQLEKLSSMLAATPNLAESSGPGH